MQGTIPCPQTFSALFQTHYRSSIRHGEKSEMSAERIRLRLEGTRPLLMHSGRLADPLDPAALDLAHITAKRPKTRADLEEISRREWYGGLWLHGGRPCIPQ